MKNTHWERRRPRHLSLACAFAAAFLLPNIARAQTLPSLPESPSPTLEWNYDGEGQVTLAETAKGTPLYARWAYKYFPSGRLESVIDPGEGSTLYKYTVGRHLVSVTSPSNIRVVTVRNEFGETTTYSNPDSGIKRMEIGADGKVDKTVDARGVTSKIDYDALGRSTSLVFSKSGLPSESFLFQYDGVGTGYSNGIGRLTRIEHPSGSSRYLYDPSGRVVQSVQSVSGAAGANAAQLLHTVGYAYDQLGRVTSITYPSGRRIHYSFSGGKLASVSLGKDATTAPAPLISQIQWDPAGLVKGWKWEMTTGTSTHERTYDKLGRIVRYKIGGTLRDLTYDAQGKIENYKHYASPTWSPQPALDQAFKYDSLGRLVTISTATSTTTLGYDGDGVRLRSSINGLNREYTANTGTHQYSGITTPAVQFAYDEVGNLLSSNEVSAKYNLAGNLSSITRSGVTSFYNYDNFNRRIRKFTSAGSGSAIIFVYNQDGNILGEYSSTGAPIREYVWMGSLLISIFVPDSVAANPPVAYFVHTDHLGTPRLVVNKNGQRRWRWLADPFGTAAPETNPDGVGNFVQNLRYPGQYWDAESGFFYNGHRYYDPSLGAYIQSDPVGLRGGLNAYAYVGSNPLTFVDPLGLARKNVALGAGYTGGIDTFNTKGEASFEIHVFDKNGKEVGFFGPDGWFDKHGKVGKPEGLPDSVENACKAQAADLRRRMGKPPHVGDADTSRTTKLKGVLKGAAIIGPMIEMTRPSAERACEIDPTSEAC